MLPFIQVEITIDGKEKSNYVAKHFYNIGSGENNITLEENTDYLEREAHRAALGKYFLDAFYSQVKEEGTEVSTSMNISSLSVSASTAVTDAYSFRFCVC